ncbi:hypothetical protein H9P43_006482 [Blastocladiella emersonii ATCC 22665]|nr:hypothetical protein H9P43_006482 [Blastocladiella emersonii ATCC 22665]
MHRAEIGAPAPLPQLPLPPSPVQVAAVNAFRAYKSNTKKPASRHGWLMVQLGYSLRITDVMSQRFPERSDYDDLKEWESKIAAEIAPYESSPSFAAANAGTAGAALALHAESQYPLKHARTKSAPTTVVDAVNKALAIELSFTLSLTRSLTRSPDAYSPTKRTRPTVIGSDSESSEVSPIVSGASTPKSGPQLTSPMGSSGSASAAAAAAAGTGSGAAASAVSSPSSLSSGHTCPAEPATVYASTSASASPTKRDCCICNAMDPLDSKRPCVESHVAHQCPLVKRRDGLKDLAEMLGRGLEHVAGIDRIALVTTRHPADRATTTGTVSTSEIDKVVLFNRVDQIMRHIGKLAEQDAKYTPVLLALQTLAQLPDSDKPALRIAYLLEEVCDLLRPPSSAPSRSASPAGLAPAPAAAPAAPALLPTRQVVSPRRHARAAAPTSTNSASSSSRPPPISLSPPSSASGRRASNVTHATATASSRSPSSPHHARLRASRGGPPAASPPPPPRTAPVPGPPRPRRTGGRETDCHLCPAIAREEPNAGLHNPREHTAAECELLASPDYLAGIIKVCLRHFKARAPTRDTFEGVSDARQLFKLISSLLDTAEDSKKESMPMQKVLKWRVATAGLTEFLRFHSREPNNCVNRYKTLLALVLDTQGQADAAKLLGQQQHSLDPASSSSSSTPSMGSNNKKKKSKGMSEGEPKKGKSK